MAYSDYSQGDKNWGSTPYPYLPYCLTYNGCGPTTAANLITYLKKKVTPKETGVWMRQHGYAVAGHGTQWAGMPAVLRHWGLTDVEFGLVKNSWSAFAKYKTGYVLMSKGTKGGITWTASGHYMAIENYMTKNGKHYFYLCDSGNRCHDGWFCYETTMYGLVAQIHVVYDAKAKQKTVKRATTKKTTPKNPNFRKGLKKGAKGDAVKTLQKRLNKIGYNLRVDGKFGALTEDALKDYKKARKLKNPKLYDTDTAKLLKAEIAKMSDRTMAEKAADWAFKIAHDNKYTYGKGGPKHWYHGRPRAKQVGCPFCGTDVTGPKKAKKGSRWSYTMCCNAFAMAAYVHGGGLYKKCKNGSTKASYWTKLTKGGKQVFKIVKVKSVKDLKKGDLLANGSHIKIYVGHGQVAHAKRQGWDAGSICVETLKSIGNYKVIRCIMKK